jgi:hypothetical protein
MLMRTVSSREPALLAALHGGLLDETRADDDGAA